MSEKSDIRSPPVNGFTIIIWIVAGRASANGIAKGKVMRVVCSVEDLVGKEESGFKCGVH
jgi:hypothetical protein